MNHSTDYLILPIEAYRLLTDGDKASLEKAGEREIMYQLHSIDLCQNLSEPFEDILNHCSVYYVHK